MKDQANWIKFAAVVTAIPRWVVALMASEGLQLPPEWRPWWVWFSFLSAAGMAVVEGLAFSYVFNAYKRDKNLVRGRILLALSLVSAIIFVMMLAPSIAASVREEGIAAVLSNQWLLWLWSATVAASTISIVASVGYAQRAVNLGGEEDKAPRPATTGQPSRKTELPKPAEEAPAPAAFHKPTSRDEFMAQMRGGANWTTGALVKAGMPRSTAKLWLSQWRDGGVVVAPGNGSAPA